MRLICVIDVSALQRDCPSLEFSCLTIIPRPLLKHLTNFLFCLPPVTESGFATLTASMPNTEDREVVVRFDPAKGLYFRELRPKRKLCPKCSQIPLAFFVGPGLEGGVGFLNLITSMPSNTYEDIPIIHTAAFGHDFSNPANFKHLSYRDVKQSAKNGCHLCTLVVRSFESGEQSAFTPVGDMGEGFIVLTHQVRRFPFGSKCDAIVPILGRGSHSGPIAAVGLYLRIMIAEVPGRCSSLAASRGERC